MKPWPELTHFVGFDWATDHHDIVVVDRAGQVAADFSFEDTAVGWASFLKQMGPFAAPAVVIETCQGATVERLMELGLTVYPINPKNAQRYRERKVSSGAKSDRLDAWSFGDALRTDGHAWRALQPEDPLIVELRQLCRDEIALIEQRTALVNQLREALRQYYPAVLEAFDDWTRESAWAFVEKFPTPQALIKAGKRKWENFLHSHKLYRPETYEKRLACFARAEEFCGSPPTTAAKSLLAVTLCKTLRALELQLEKYRERIDELFRRHPDHDLFGSLPGAGEKIAPRLMSEIGTDRGRFDAAEALQCYGGTAPVTYESGKSRRVYFRRACSKVLRSTVQFLADHSRAKCAWAAAYYQKKIEEGKAHNTALRCLGQRWLKIIWKMWQTRASYDPELHQRNQLAHGSWVLKLLPSAQPAQ